MSVITWTCESCGHTDEGLSVDRYMDIANGHVCTVADQIRRAERYMRDRTRRGGPLELVADWLADCADQADDMAHPTDFEVCDEPGSVKWALAVAQATPWTEATR